jgi:curved DNA-binding protein
VIGKDYYRVLGVRPTADEPAIKTAFRRLARRCHPDVARRERNSRRFSEIVEAYQLLSDPERRQQYDREYHERRATSRAPATRARRFTRGDRPAPRAGRGAIALDVFSLGIRLAVDVELER